MLVMGVSNKPAVKRFFETEFAKQLKDHGVESVPSFSVFPSEKMIEKDAIAREIKDLGIDAVLITRLVERKTVETYVPGTRSLQSIPQRGWHSYYASSYSYVYDPGYTIEDEVVILETNIYNAKNEKLIWSALSETFMEGSGDEIIRSFIKTIIKNMSKESFIGSI
jgi:hypothetical protein